MKLTRQERARIAEQAALHLVRIREGSSPEAEASFNRWVQKSADHVHETLFMHAWDDALKDIDPGHTIDVDALPTPPELLPSIGDDSGWAAELCEEGGRPAPTGAPRVASNAPRRRSRRLIWMSGVAAACASIVVIWLFQAGRIWMNPLYVTAVGEQRSIKLADGSVMILNTGSRAQVVFSERAREVRLLDGEAMFIVEHDATRAFQVHTDAGTVRAVGTQFNVYQRDGITRVSVVEGIVQLSPTHEPGVPGARLEAGDEADLAGGYVAKTAHPDVERAVAWRTRQLVFRDTPLREIAREFNRYNEVQIRIEGDEVGALSYSGVFDADDALPLTRFIADDPELTVERSAQEIVIRQRVSENAQLR